MPAAIDNPELCSFVRNELPAGYRDRADEVLMGLDHARECYERYAKTRSRWWNAKARKGALGQIAKLSEQLLAGLGNLDPISEDDLKGTLGNEKFALIQADLNEIRQRAASLAEPIRTNGHPTDVARERWIHEVADIYEHNFKKGADIIYGRGRSNANRGPFYKLLRLSMPETFPRYGSLDPRQVKRVLDRRTGRRKRRHATRAGERA